MKSINWSEFNGEKFQTFCNILFSFEFGKKYTPFNGPGADQGIDGLFEGDYNGVKGKWRFQAKFHHPDTGRVAGFNQLKGQIKKDLLKNIQDETCIVFVTNVDLNPNQQKELKKIGIESIEKTKKQVRFEIWDGGKLFTLLARHPLVSLWYIEQTEYLIQEYTDFFHEELNANENDSYKLNNNFYFRGEKIDKLNEFLHNNSKKVAILSGEPGIGKTRLCLEFFKEKIDVNDDWRALVLASHQIDLNIIKLALSGEKNYILLLDDADKFDGRELADLLTLVKQSRSNIIKVLLTVRSSFIDQIHKEISPSDRTDRLVSISLDQFTREETVQILEKELSNYRIQDYLGSFVELTHGVPIMIQSLIRIVKSGKPLKDIKKDTFLKSYITELIDQVIVSTSDSKEVPKKDITNVVRITSLIEPIRIDDKNLIQLIAINEGLQEEDVESVLVEMKSKNLLTGNYQQEIKPDLYSDLILEEAIKNNNWLEKKLTNYGAYINNIIRNIAYINQNDQGNQVFQNLLKTYIKQIDDCKYEGDLKKILDTIQSASYSMPSIAMEAVKKTISIYSNKTHNLNSYFQESLIYKNHSLDSTLNSLKGILRNLFNLEEFYLESFKQSGNLYKIYNDEGIVSNIASFGKRDISEQFNCNKQQQILKASSNCLELPKCDLKLFALKALQNILKLEFFDTESHLYQKHSIQIYTINIPENQNVKSLRKESIDVLFKFYKSESEVDLKEECFKIILDLPRSIFAARKNNYKGTQEIKAVLSFIEDLSINSDISLKQKQAIKDQLYWLKRWGIDNSFYPVIDSINENLSEEDLSERLLNMFNPKFNEDYNEEVQLFNTETLKIISEYTGVEIGTSLVLIIEQTEHEPHMFYQFLGLLSEDPVKSKEMIEHLWIANKSFVVKYCSGFFRQYRFSENNQTHFDNYVTELLEINTVDSRNFLLQVYDPFQLHNIFNKLGKWNLLTAEDVRIIDAIIKESTIENYYNIASTLPSLLYYDSQIAINRIKAFLKICQERHLDRFFLAIHPIEDKYYEELKDILINDTLHLNIPYSIERFLNKIITYEGFETVLHYFEKRFLYQRKYVLENKSLLGYEFVPTHHGNSITAGFNEDQKTEIFLQVLKWYVQFHFEDYESFYASNIIEIFTPNKFIDDKIKKEYFNLIHENSDDYQKLMNIVKSLGEFKQKNENFIDLIIVLLNTIHDNFSDDEKINEFNTQCYMSLTAMGVKSGISGQPFSVDIQLKEMIEATINSTKLKNPLLLDFFRKVLKSVQADIAREDEKGENELW